MSVKSQASLGFPENAQWRAQGVDFATVNIVGSTDLLPWTGIGKTTATPEQIAEEAARMNAAIAEIKDAFATATQKHDRAVVILLQRITVDGSSNNLDWLSVTVNRPGAGETLSWTRVPYQHQA